MIEINALASSSRGNAYYFNDGVAPLLVECGLSFRDIQRGIGFSVSGLAGCLVTHEHKDHSKAAVELMKAGVDVYASKGTIEMLKLQGHRIRPVEALKQFEIDSWTVLPFDVQHDAAEPLGYLLQSRSGAKVLYATDTYYIKYQFKGLTHILLECNYADDLLQQNVLSGALHPAIKKRIRRSHFSLDNVKTFLKANDLSKVREIWLIHLSDGNSDAERFKRKVQSLTGKPVIVAAEREAVS